MYLLICGTLVLFMYAFSRLRTHTETRTHTRTHKHRQAGFAMLEAGSIKSLNVRNVLFKNMIDASLGGFWFYLIGYGFAYGGSSDNSFIGEASSGGEKNFAFRVDPEYETETERVDIGYEWISFFFQYAFAAAATTIVSGAVAGRTKLVSYLAYSTLITSFIYPVVVHWIWDSNGWISAFNEDTLEGGMIDFAGSGVVHMTGGVAALVGAVFVGARKGRFDSSTSSTSFDAHSAPLQVLGTFILWIGWYGFNCGSTLGITGYSHAAARAAVTTTLSAISAGLSVCLIVKVLDNCWDLGATCNGVLAGLVSITAGCSVTESWAALVIGLVGGAVYVVFSRLMIRLKVDDPLDAFAIHGACGAWGCLAVGLFTTTDYTYNSEGYSGLFYGSGTLLGVQLLGVLCIFAWTAVTTGALFATLSFFDLLRVSDREEEEGLDVSEHESPAYVIIGMQGGPPMKKNSMASVKPSV